MSSKRQQIVDAVETRLKTIKTANGYTTNLGDKVFTWKPSPISSDNDLPCITIRDTANQRDSGTTAMWRWRLTLEIEIACSSGTTTDDTLRKMLEDVYKAIGTDPLFGGLAALSTEANEDRMEIFKEEKTFGGATVEIVIPYDCARFSM